MTVQLQHSKFSILGENNIRRYIYNNIGKILIISRKINRLKERDLKLTFFVSLRIESDSHLRIFKMSKIFFHDSPEHILC